jgi:hypothetical protein
VRTGTSVLGPNFPDANFDPVVMDDFLYSNPVPEPGALAPFMMSGALLLLRRRSA